MTEPAEDREAVATEAGLPRWSLVVPADFRPLLNGLRTSRRPLAATAYILAGIQRAAGHACLSSWRPRDHVEPLDVEVLTLACERDRVLLFRMLDSLISRVGDPKSLVVVSDGSLSRKTLEAIGRFAPRAEIAEANQLLEEGWVTPTMVEFASKHPLGIKLVAMMRPSRSPSRVFVDTDVEFLRGAHRFRAAIDNLGAEPRYMQHEQTPDQVANKYGHDLRLVGDRDVLPGVNSGVVVWRELVWQNVIERLPAVATDPTPLSEQTAVAMAISDSGGLPLDPNDYILEVDDLGRLRDRYARADVVLRHYYAGLKWKMFIKGGPAGPASVPDAICRRMFTALRRLTRSDTARSNDSPSPRS